MGATTIDCTVTPSEMVIEVLREQPRNLETIGWGIYQVFECEMDAHCLLHLLEKLEKQGKAIRHQSAMSGMPSMIWWKVPSRSSCPYCGRPLKEGDGAESPPLYCDPCSQGWPDPKAIQATEQSLRYAERDRPTTARDRSRYREGN